MPKLLPFLALCEQFALGQFKDATLVPGQGKLHRVWQIHTSSGCYALKVLRTDLATQQYIKQWETISQHVMRLATMPIPVNCARLSQSNKPYACIEGSVFVCFPWVAGKHVGANQLNLKQAHHIGRLLAEIHMASEPGLPLAAAEHCTTSTRQWQQWVSSMPELSWVLDHKSELIAAKCQLDANEHVVSHRDMTVGNLLWQTNQVSIIDWEWAGYIHPAVDLFATALNQSLRQDIQPNPGVFQTIIAGYKQRLPETEMSVDAFYCVLYHWLSWVELNLQWWSNNNLASNIRLCAQQEARETCRILKKLFLYNDLIINLL